MVTTLNGVNLGTITEETVEQNGNIVPLPITDTVSSESEAFDFGGATKTISVTGIKSDPTEANLKSFIESLENIIGPDQDTTVDYVSDFRGTLKVKVLSVRSTKTEPSRLKYDIKLVEGV
jgi:hypothetical protein